MILDYNKITDWISKESLNHLPVIYLGYNRYNYPLVKNINNIDVSDILESSSMFDYIDILRNAKVCHMMNSSFALLLDHMTTTCRHDQHRVIYQRFNFPSKNSRVMMNSKWEHEDTMTMINEYDNPNESR
jgi:hypothetical protein